MPTKPGNRFSFCNEFQAVLKLKDRAPVFKREDMELPEELFSKPVVLVDITPYHSYWRSMSHWTGVSERRLEPSQRARDAQVSPIVIVGGTAQGTCKGRTKTTWAIGTRKVGTRGDSYSVHPRGLSGEQINEISVSKKALTHSEPAVLSWYCTVQPVKVVEFESVD